MSADSELKKLWQVPRKRADLNLSVDFPSMCWNGTDTTGNLSWCYDDFMHVPTSFLRHGPQLSITLVSNYHSSGLVNLTYQKHRVDSDDT